MHKAYKKGFNKVAEKYGIDPNALVKIAKGPGLMDRLNAYIKGMSDNERMVAGTLMGGGLGALTGGVFGGGKGALLGGIGGGLAGATGGYGVNKYLARLKDISKLRADNRDLERINEKLTGDYEALKGSNARLTGDLASTREQLKNQKLMYDNFKKELSDPANEKYVVRAMQNQFKTYIDSQTPENKEKVLKYLAENGFSAPGMSPVAAINTQNWSKFPGIMRRFGDVLKTEKADARAAFAAKVQQMQEMAAMWRKIHNDPVLKKLFMEALNNDK